MGRGKQGGVEIDVVWQAKRRGNSGTTHLGLYGLSCTFIASSPRHPLHPLTTGIQRTQPSVSDCAPLVERGD